MGGNPIRLNAPQQGVKTDQYVQPGAGENQPVQVQLGNDVHNLSPVEPNPQQTSPVIVPPLFSERAEANVLNVAQRNLGLPQEPPGQPKTLDERKVAPGDPQRQGEHLHFDVGKGFCVNRAVQTGVGDFEVIEADPVEEPANLAKGEAKVVATDFEAIKALLASGKRGAGQFSVNRQTHALTTVNDNVLSFLNPKSNPLMSGLVSTPAENKSIRKVVRDALLGEVTKLREEIATQKTAVTGNDPASQRVRDAFDALLGHLAATADGIKKSIVPPEASKQTAALDKAGVQALADELAEIGKALRKQPDVQIASDYEQALKEYSKTLDEYEIVLDANKRNLETNQANQTKNEQALAGYEKTCAEMISTAKADYERNCAEERASRRKTAADGHRAEHDGKVKEYNAFVKSREDGMKAHLSDLKAKYGTDKFDDLAYLKSQIFTKAPENTNWHSYLQLEGSTSGKLNYYYYYSLGNSSNVAENNKAARQQLQASLAHALWEAGLENDEYGQGQIAKLGGDSLEKALDYSKNYDTVKAVFDLIDQDGKQAPGEYKPLTEEELSAQVQYDPQPFDPASVQLPPKPQLLDTAELNELPPLGKLPPEPVLGQKPAGNGVDSLLGELALAKQEQKLSGLRERIPELKTRQTALAQEGLLLQENLLGKKYGVKSFQPVFKLIQEKDCFRDAGTRGRWSVRLVDAKEMLTYQSESRLNVLAYTQMSEAQNKTIRNQLMASLERETWRAGLADSKRMQTFLAHAAKTLQLGNPEAMGQKLDYVDAFELLHEFQMSVAAENPAFVAAEVSDSDSNKPVKNQGAAVAEAPKAGAAANVQPGEVRPAGVPSSLGSLGLSYAQFGGQLLNPLVEHLFDGMGVSLSGISLSGDKDGLKLEIKTFDASDMGVVANDGLLAKYENVTIPIKAKWNDGRLSFELGKLGCADPAKAERLNTLVKIARESGVLGGLEMPKGMSVESGNALGVVCDFRQMDVAMLADMGFGSNLAETIGGVRFSEKGVMVDFGKADNPLKLPQLDEKSGAMDIHLNVSTILNRCQGFLTRMMRDGMGVEVGEIGVSTTADGIVKFSLTNAKVLEGGWLRTFDLASIGNLELEIRPTLNAETGLLEISLENLNVQTAGGFGGRLVGFASRFADYALSWAVSYAPNMVCQKERGNAMAKVSLALPNLMPEQFAFLGTQTLTKFAVSEKGIAIGIGMEPKPIRFAKPQPVAPKAPEAPVAPEAPAKPVVPPPAGDLKRLGHLGTVGVSYKSFTDEILRPLMAQVAMDLGIDVRGLSLSGSSGGLRLNLSRLDLQGMLAKLGDSSSPTVRGLLKAFKWQKFDNVSIPISAQWNAQAGKLEFALGEIEGTSADGATLNRLVQDLRASGLLRALPASGAMAVVDEANQPLKLSFDLSSASVKELKSMGFNERLMDNVGDIRFRPEGVSLDIGAPRPRGAEVESPGVANSALNAEVDIGAIVANNQERIKNKLQDLGIRVQNVRVRTAASDGTLTVDLDQTNFDGLMDSWKSYGWYYKLAKPFLRTPGMSIKLRPSFDPATGKTSLAIVDFSVKGVLGPLTAFIGKRLVGPSWLSAMAPNLLSNEKAGKGELVRVSLSSSNLLPSALAGFGSQKISGLKVTNRGLAVGVGTNWRTELLKDNQATQQSIQLQFARTRQRIAELLRNPEFIDRYGSVLRYLTALAGILEQDVSVNFLRERCEDIRNARLEHAEEIQQGWRQIQELVKNENFRRRFNVDEVTAASFPDVEDLAAALFTTLREE